MGALPAAGQWTLLSVSASKLDLIGKTVKGLSFITYDGRVRFDGAGVGTCAAPVAAAPSSFPSGDVVWFDDDTPAGATKYGTWNWDTTQHASGTSSHTEPTAVGRKQHHFAGGTPTLAVGTGDKLVVYVMLNPCDPPQEILIGWFNGTNWEHRAYWGANIFTDGVNGTNSRRPMGALPASGQWVRLEVPASQVGLEGATVQGMAFTVQSGQAFWDRAGKAPLGSGLLEQVPGTEISSATLRPSVWSRVKRLLVRRRKPAPEPPVSLTVNAEYAQLTQDVTSVTTGRKYSFYSPELQLMAESETTTAATPAIAYEYVWFNGEPLAQIETATGAIHYYFNDHLGTPILTTNNTGAVDWRVEREAYGEIFTVRNGADRYQPLAFPGQEEDGTAPERQYNIMRWYRPGWSRYGQPDPLGVRAGENVYIYTEDNPTTWIDPDGLERVTPLERTICALSNPIGCYALRKCRREARDRTLARFYYNTDDSPANAYLHCYWSCCAAKIAGRYATQRGTDMHESYPANPACRKDMDLHNNEVGRGKGFFGPYVSCDSHCWRNPDLQDRPIGGCQPCGNRKPYFPF